MQRTQVYLTLESFRQLKALVRSTNRKQSDLIREAIESYLSEKGHAGKKVILADARGMWAERSDLPDFAKLRQELDRDCSS